MLSDVGRKITTSLNDLFSTQNTDETIENVIKEVCTQLLNANVSPKLLLTLRKNIKKDMENLPPGINKAKHCHQKIVSEIVNLLDPGTKPPELSKKSVNIVLFVGLQGCGKTTTVCKYANFYQKQKFKVGIVCADTFRAGAFDQIKQNALKIKVPYYGSEEKDPVKVARKGVEKFVNEKFNLILIDSSGRNTQEKELFDEMQQIISAVTPTNIVFVMDAGIGQAAESQAKGFSDATNIGSIILTKIDGTKKAGGALTSVATTKCPVEFVGSGENMEDFDKFDVKRFVNKMLGLGDIEGLVEKVSSLNIDEKALMKKVETGTFTLKDFYDQFQQIMSLGPLQNILSMIPGMNNVNMPEEDSLRKMVCIFDSLSKNEINSDGRCFEECPSRVLRVARGSGTSYKMVYDLLAQFRQITGMMKKMTKIPGFGDLANKDPSKMSLAEKTRMKNQMKGMLPKNIYDSMSQMFN
ncbi:signal recognition particle protein SRP54 [Edhazardia aedis USNM 41457]|uniref:signal-recognition-particle GTPase n=1 Tax=Edhazardia aedis (strain USNM 41457) TaxID=1003232 RepID=J9DLW6_EDHAE|nr:signal recognition particle protein SRP54 [Edhazardia aedis USNM 41457]|eukprot:EJW02377.1 signal recognition particle protein SRP54 [Edhazardia aedis USNM 41457]